MNKSFLSTAILFLVLTSSTLGAKAAARSYFSPSLLGDPIAFCASGNEVCGKAVADNWCTNKGFEKSILFQRQRNNSTASSFIRYADNGKACTGNNCLSFAQIKCYSGN